MNAYELADFIDKYCEGNTIKESANMLRQQADRIAELEKQLAFMEGEYPEPTIVEKMKEFEEQSEPVAWKQIRTELNNEGDVIGEFSGISLNAGWEELPHNAPLYTTPHHASDVKQTKPLSYEEYENRFDGDEKYVRAIEAKVRGQ